MCFELKNKGVYKLQICFDKNIMKLLLLIFSFFGNEVECSICYKRKDLDKNDIKFLLLIKRKKKDF